MTKWEITLSKFGKFLLVASICALISLCFVMSVTADDPEVNQVSSPSSEGKGTLWGGRLWALPSSHVPPGLEYDDAVKYPIRYWRAWANQEIPIGRILWILLVTLLPLQLILPNHVARVRSQYEQHWASSLGFGLLFLIFSGPSCGFLARTGLYAPLATLLLGLVQLTTLFGLTVACNSIGSGALSILRLEKRIEKSKFYKVVTICLGIFLCSLLVLVPGHRLLPGLGIRLLALIAAAGTGAVLVSMKKKDES
jgi:hypothetical protein